MAKRLWQPFWSVADRFDLALSQIFGKRFTYTELTGHADDEPF